MKNQFILALCAVSLFSSWSGRGKMGYVLEADWDYEGWKHSKQETDLANVNMDPSGDGTYTVGPGGCVG